MIGLAAAIGVVAQLIEFGGAVAVAAAVVRAVLELVAGGGIDRARLQVIAGVIGALGFKTAASLLKALELNSWHAIGTFAAVFAIRTAIKRWFVWERARLHGTQSRSHATKLRDSVTIAISPVPASSRYSGDQTCASWRR